MSKILLLAVSGIFIWSSAPALAGLGKFTITDDSGDQVIVKHGLFGRKVAVEDRNGNGFEKSRSLFGLTKDTKVGVLGNEMHSHKGLFGFSKTEGHTMLGDTVTSNKNPIYRNTNINLSGVNELFNKYIQPKPVNAPLNPPMSLNHGQSYPSNPINPNPLTSSPSINSTSNQSP